MEKKKATTCSTTNQNKIILLNHHHNSTAAAAAEYHPRRKSAAENGDQYSSFCRSSSGSSSGDYLFSSSEAESTSKTSSSSYTKYRPKPIRTGASTVHRLSSSTCTTNHDQQPHKHKQTSSIAAGTSIFRNQEMKLLVKKRSDEKHQQGSSTKTINSGDHFSKTKSKALKIYADLRKVKRPLSPGGKLATFFTSIFNNNNNNNNNTNNDHNNDNNNKAKKAKVTLVSSNEEEVISKSRYSAHHHASNNNCSSASSFSRTTSCLSKSSTTQPSTCKRSVRFYPLTTVIVEGTDCLETTTAAAASQRDKRNHNDSRIREIMNWRGEEVARDMFKSSYLKRSAEFKNTIMDINDHEEEEDDDDAASCASSDLFELDNLNSHHAFERYGEELPLYETTYFDTNRAIANGLIV